MPTLVAVYRIEPDKSTGEFVGFGSILDPAVVFLHPRRGRPPHPDGPAWPHGPQHPDRPAWPERSSLATDQESASTLAAESSRPVGPTKRGARVRCRISSDIEMTLDGTVLGQPVGVASAPTAVCLDTGFSGGVDPIDVPQGIGHPTAEEAAEAVLAFLEQVAVDDPSEPAEPPPDTADTGEPHPHPGRRPWYCVICPGAFGC